MTQTDTARMNNTPPGFEAGRDLPAGFMDFYLPLHQKFTSWQTDLVAKRAAVLQQSQEGLRPDHLPTSEASESDWRVTLPEWVLDQRNQMTGPADDGELVVKMLNSGAPGVMIDLEDSIANTWEHVTDGYANALEALYGTLSYYDKKRSQQVAIKDSKTVLFTRLRGLHLHQVGIFPDELTSASLLDLAMIMYQVDVNRLKHPICFYIPKSESAEEALWWDAAFKAVSEKRGLPADYIKCMALVEAHPLAYQIEEFAYNLRDHLMGLNLGRWDYMASLIHFNLDDPNWVLPDRNTIPFDVAFFQNLRELIPEICHKRGLMAIGGMTALFPDRSNKELNDRALSVLERDKKNEAVCLMDGAWTGHPDQNEIAVAQFPYPNQLDKRKPDAPRYPDLRPAPIEVGQRTLTGSRTAARVTTLYRYGVLTGKGASLIFGFMEDLATDRIYRLMLAQRVMHFQQVPILDENGQPVQHDAALLTRLYDEELAKLIEEGNHEPEILHQARQQSEAMITNSWHDPI